MINYIIEASICLACFYSIYWFFLRKEKLLSINRFYLLSTAMISLIIPLLSFEIGLNIFETSQKVTPVEMMTQLEASRHITPSDPIISVGLVYGIGLAIASLLLVAKVIYAKRKIGKSISFKAKPIEVAETEGLAAFSFLNTIFIGKDLSHNSELKTHIIAHESAHIRGKHSLDLFFFELLKCLFWFNPFSYLYSKSIKLQHEYIADQHALEMTSPASYQRSLLELTLSQVNSSLISNFNEHPIETRLKMIQKLNSNVMNKLKTLFAVPVLALLFIAFACTESIEPEGELLDIVEQEIPLAGELNPLSDQLKTIIDSMRVIEGKGAYLFKYKVTTDFEGDNGEREIHEIPNSELRKAAYILKSIEEAKASGAVIEVIDEQDPQLQKDLQEYSKKAVYSFREKGSVDNNSAKVKEAYELVFETKDNKKN